MSLLPKSHKKVSSRQQMKIKEVRDGILILPNNRYCSVIESSSINFELKSEAEQDVLIDSFQNFLNALPCQLQILVRIRELDVDRYVHQISKNATEEKEKVYQEQGKNYTEFIQKLVSGNKILSRRFYIIIPYITHDTSDFNLIHEQVLLNQDIVMKGLEKMGMRATALSSIEILNLFYSFYNFERSKIQELKAQTSEALFNQLYDL